MKYLLIFSRGLSQIEVFVGYWSRSQQEVPTCEAALDRARMVGSCALRSAGIE